MLRLFVIVTLFFLPTFPFAYSINSSTNCILTYRWHVSVTSDLPDDMIIFVHGPDYHQKISLSFRESMSWYFCQLGRVYYGEVTWGSKNTTVVLYNDHIKRFCGRFKFGIQHCYWLITTDGFYVSRHNSPFPNSDWHFEAPWSWIL